MSEMQTDLGTPLEWIAVAHYNTEHLHVHIALRGVGGEGKQVCLSRDYIRGAKFGFGWFRRLSRYLSCGFSWFEGFKFSKGS